MILLVYLWIGLSVWLFSLTQLEVDRNLEPNALAISLLFCLACWPALLLVILFMWMFTR